MQITSCEMRNLMHLIHFERYIYKMIIHAYRRSLWMLNVLFFEKETNKKNVEHNNFHSRHSSIPFILFLASTNIFSIFYRNIVTSSVQRSMRTHVNCLDCTKKKKEKREKDSEFWACSTLKCIHIENGHECLHRHHEFLVRVCVFKRQNSMLKHLPGIWCTMYSITELCRTIDCYVNILSTEHPVEKSNITITCWTLKKF